MRPVTLILFIVAHVAATSAIPAAAQSRPGSIALRPHGPEVRPEPKFTFLLFTKGNSDKTQRVANELATALGSHGDRAQWQTVDATDSANQSIVNRYQLGRAPMPLVLCVAPNGAVTGVMPGHVTEAAVEKALVTPTMTRCMKSLQAGKIVVVHVKSSPAEKLPAGASAFLADPAFQNRSATESLVIDDPAEGRFLREMKIDPAAVSSSSVVVLAPPGMLVGKFPATVTGSDIAAQLHAAGKCCNDPNCKHNQKGR